MKEESDNEELAPPTKKQKVEETPSAPNQDSASKQDLDPNQDLAPNQDSVPNQDGTKQHPPENDTDNNPTASDDRYTNYVTPEEVDKLREFRVLDEVKSNDEDSNDCSSDSSTGESVDLPEEEIEKMLEEDLPDDFKAAPKPKEKAYITREKIILEEKGVNHFEVLPLDWIMIRHQSGMPIYVHRATRVCTLSKPYFLGKSNAKRHDIPISAIPCLAYRRALEEEERQNLIDQKVEEQIKLGTWNMKEEDKTKSGKTNPNNVTEKIAAPTFTDVSAPSENKENKADKSIKVSEETVNSGSPPGQCPFKSGLAVNSSDKCPVTNAKSSSESALTIDNNKDHDENLDNAVLDKERGNNEGVEANKAQNSELNTVVENGIRGDSNEGMVNSDNPSTSLGDKMEIPANRQPIVLPGGIVMPSPRVETVNTSWKTQHLTHEQVNEYCKKLFKFKVLNIMHFKRWADRRKYTKARKALQYPMLPEGTKLITIPVQSTSGQDTTGTGKPTKRDWVMNMNGRSYLSVFHEYARRALQKQPVYEFKQLENASTPYQATVFIGGMQYGVGHGSSKRQAKSAAARASIHILIPEMREHLEPGGDPEPDFVFFDYVGIEDPRIAEFCAATCEPTPHAILRTCLLRNFGAGDRHIHTEMKKLEYQKIEMTMKVGKHSATVVCKNKKTAKQRASQAILQALHPHVRSWGSLLRLYGSRSVKSCKEKKLEEQQITLLQDKARNNEPNYAVLDKLRHEMRKLRERDEAVVPIGTLLLAHPPPSHSASGLNNVEL